MPQSVRGQFHCPVSLTIDSHAVFELRLSMIFLTCVDTVAERTALMESVYPQLYLYCKQRGYDFRMIDLRRGVEDPVTDHHESVELHLEMLKRCQETEGLSFFVSLAEFIVVSFMNNCANN